MTLGVIFGLLSALCTGLSLVLVKNVIPYYQFAKPHEKEEIVRVIFSELYVAENTLEYKCKKGFECFENRFLALCDPTGNRTPI